jgi:hypothetical protein
MKTRCIVILLAIGFFLTAPPAPAHHAFAAEYDVDKPIKLTGSVTKIDWRNPHAWFYIDVKDENGKITNWGFELPTPNTLMRAGWTRNSMKIGDMVIVEGTRSKDGTANANAKTVTLSDTGKKLFDTATATIAPE